MNESYDVLCYVLDHCHFLSSNSPNSFFPQRAGCPPLCLKHSQASLCGFSAFRSQISAEMPPSQTLNIASPCIPVASFHIIYRVYRSLHTICLLAQGLLHNKTIVSTLRGLVSPVHYSIYHPEHFWVPMCWTNE